MTTPEKGDNYPLVVDHISHRYGNVTALDDVSLHVAPGELVVLLGPNGAGKTTLVSIVEGFLTPSGGVARITGHDCATLSPAARGDIGLVLQECALPRLLTVHELISMYHGYYDQAQTPSEVLATSGLTDLAHRRVRTLSGGEQRRLELALALMAHPRVVILDEPFTGFDPQARKAARERIAALASDQVAVLMTTHDLDEAQQLADRVVVLIKGKVVADCSPDALGARAGAARLITCTIPVGATLPSAFSSSLAGTTLTHNTTAPVEDLHSLTQWALAHHIALGDISVRRPSLEEIYLEMVS